MNPQLNYYLARARTADVIREGRHQRIAGAARRRQHRTRPAIRRIIDSVTRARTTSVSTGQHPPLKLSAAADKSWSHFQASRGSATPRCGDGSRGLAGAGETADIA
jgi:hypothetical protein